MKSAIFITLMAVALVGLAACAPATTPSIAPTAGAQALATATVVIGNAPALLATETTAPTENAAATSAATSASTVTVPSSAPTQESTPTTEATIGAGTSATSAATTEATSVATSAPTAAGTSAAPPSATSAAGSAPAQTVTVVGTEFKFEPNQLTFKAGQRARIVFQNQGTVDHELEVEDLKADNVVLDLSKAGNIPEDERDEATGDASSGEVHEYAAAGGSATIDFTPTTAGTYNFACNLPGHKESGMTGTIVVQP